jgi:hypothetical protein
MAVGPFLSHDSGIAELFGSLNWATGDYYAVLLASGTGTQDRATEVDWEDISALEITDEDYSKQALADTAVSLNGTKVQFTCDKITFTAAGDVTARYLYILEGDVASPANGDLILGHIDLSGATDISSVNGEFSFTPDAVTGLFEIPRSAAPGV